VNTVESDLEAGRAVQQIGFETIQCAVGDKWILWQACFYDWQAKREFYLNKIAASEFRILQEQVRTRLEQMVQSTKFDALSATTTFMSLEKWVSNNIGDELVNSAYDHVCQQQNNIFAIGSEESGHVITLAKLNSCHVNRPVFIGNGLKCALNSLAAIQALRSAKNTPEFFEWLKCPFPSGFQKSLPVYYVDKSLLDEGSVLRTDLEELLLANLNWPEMEVEIVKCQEEPEILLLNVLENGLTAAAVFVRNSGTEDKLALYLRGRKELEVRLESLAEKIYPFLLLSFKNKNSPMGQAEQLVLLRLKDGAKQVIDLSFEQFAKISLNRLLHEMSSRQQLIKQEGDTWSITETGRICLNNSKRSE